MTLVLRKLLASSSFAIAGALDTLVKRLKTTLAKQTPKDTLAEELDEDYEALDEAFHARVDAAFRAIAAAEPERVRSIAADGEPDAVHAAMRAAVAARFPKAFRAVPHEVEPL